MELHEYASGNAPVDRLSSLSGDIVRIVDVTLDCVRLLASGFEALAGI